MRGIAELYPNHIWKEDYVLFPMTNKVLDATSLRQVGEVDEHIGLDQRPGLEAFEEHVAEIALTVDGEVGPDKSPSLAS